MFQRFYTYAPVETEWSWILRNIKQKPLSCKHEIVDIGIYDLLLPPYRHSTEKIQLWKELKTFGWKVVPDCPDIRGEFKSTIFKNLMKITQKANKKYGDLAVHIQNYINHWWMYLPTLDTVKYSWELLTELFDPTDVSHIPVIQSEYQDMESFKRYIKRFKDKYGHYDKIAIGSICKADDNKLAIKMLKTARYEFPYSWIHAFGLRMLQFRGAWKHIDSFDSTSWTFPRGASGSPSCRNKEERIEYFWEYIEILNKYVQVEYHPEQTKLGVI